jgi:hypothetical protein
MEKHRVRASPARTGRTVHKRLVAVLAVVVFGLAGIGVIGTAAASPGIHCCGGGGGGCGSAEVFAQTQGYSATDGNQHTATGWPQAVDDYS